MLLAYVRAQQTYYCMLGERIMKYYWQAILLCVGVSWVAAMEDLPSTSNKRTPIQWVKSTNYPDDSYYHELNKLDSPFGIYTGDGHVIEIRPYILGAPIDLELGEEYDKDVFEVHSSILRKTGFPHIAKLFKLSGKFTFSHLLCCATSNNRPLLVMEVVVKKLSDSLREDIIVAEKKTMETWGIAEKERHEYMKKNSISDATLIPDKEVEEIEQDRRKEVRKFKSPVEEKINYVWLNIFDLTSDIYKIIHNQTSLPVPQWMTKGSTPLLMDNLYACPIAITFQRFLGNDWPNLERIFSSKDKSSIVKFYDSSLYGCPVECWGIRIGDV